MKAFNSKERHEKLAIVVHVLKNTYDFLISSFFFLQDGEEMYQASKRTYSCSAHWTFYLVSGVLVFAGDAFVAC